MTTSPQYQINATRTTLHMALELSATKWKLAFADALGRNPRIRTIDAGDFEQLKAELAAAKKSFRLDSESSVVSCYEAGRDAFWVHRCLVAMGIESHIVEPASIQVSRKARRAKTDRLDAVGIVNALLRWLAGDKTACRMIRIPSAEAEDARNLHREMVAIKKEKTAHSNRIKSLLAAQGITGVAIDRSFKSYLEEVQTRDGRPLLSGLKERLSREFDRLALAIEQIRQLQMQQAEMLRLAATEIGRVEPSERKSSRMVQVAYQLNELSGIGPVTSWTLAAEIFAWRDIKNRRQLGALAGLVPTPHSSGSEEKELGISKAGRGELRTLLIEIAWGWLTFQRNSKLALWYEARFGNGTSRNRKRGIVALARKLLVALGKYIRTGEIPEGAKFAKGMKFVYTPSLMPREALAKVA